MFYPTILPLLQFLADHPEGVSRGKAQEYLSRLSPEGVERALVWALKAGLVEERGELLIPLAPILPLMRKLEALAAQVNRQTLERQQAGERTMDLVRMLLGNRKGGP